MLCSGTGQGMLWHGIENAMEWKENFSIEYGGCYSEDLG